MGKALLCLKCKSLIGNANTQNPLVLFLFVLQWTLNTEQRTDSKWYEKLSDNLSRLSPCKRCKFITQVKSVLCSLFGLALEYVGEM